MVSAPQLRSVRRGTCRLTLDVGERRHHANSTTNGMASQRSTFSTAAWPSSGSTAWMATARTMKTTLAAVPAVKPALRAEQDRREDDQRDALDLESDLRDPVEEGRQPVAVGPERRPADRERRRAGLRALQAGQAGEQVEEVADQDDHDGLGEGQAEYHDASAP